MCACAHGAPRAAGVRVPDGACGCPGEGDTGWWGVSVPCHPLWCRGQPEVVHVCVYVCVCVPSPRLAAALDGQTDGDGGAGHLRGTGGHPPPIPSISPSPGLLLIPPPPPPLKIPLKCRARQTCQPLRGLWPDVSPPAYLFIFIFIFCNFLPSPPVSSSFRAEEELVGMERGESFREAALIGEAAARLLLSTCWRGGINKIKPNPPKTCTSVFLEILFASVQRQKKKKKSIFIHSPYFLPGEFLVD